MKATFLAHYFGYREWNADKVFAEILHPMRTIKLRRQFKKVMRTLRERREYLENNPVAGRLTPAEKALLREMVPPESPCTQP